MHMDHWKSKLPDGASGEKVQAPPAGCLKWVWAERSQESRSPPEVTSHIIGCEKATWAVGSVFRYPDHVRRWNGKRNISQTVLHNDNLEFGKIIVQIKKCLYILKCCNLYSFCKNWHRNSINILIFKI